MFGSAALLLTAALSMQPDTAADPAAGGHQHRHHGEFAPVAAAAELLPRTGWTVTANSEEAGGATHPATAAIDGSASTFWHTQWVGTIAPLPHTFTIDTHATGQVGGLVYLPRPAATGSNGNVGQYQVHVSADGAGWGSPVATGTFADDSTEKTVTFPATTARYVRLTALTEAGGRGAWSNAAEINLLGPADPTLPRTGWTVTADSQQTGGTNHPATAAIDGSASTFWHTQWVGTIAPLPHTFTIDMHATATVAALRYLPRPAATGRNGNIGQYQVHVSADGAGWGSPVATGTFADDSTEKTVTFPATTARYVRLTALTEAGGRGAWSNAAEINLLSSVPQADPRLGVWGAPIGFPLVPASAAQLPDGRLLTWSAYQTHNFGGSGRTQTAIFNPADGTVSQRTVTETGHDMFCPGTALLPDGRVLVNGGSDSGKTSIYNPATNAWTTAATMNIPRGYQGTTTLADGRVFTLGGSWSGGQGGKNGEVWSAAGGWQRLSGVPVTPILTEDPQGVYRADNHGWFFTWTGNRVFHAGPSRQLNWIGTAGTGSTTAAGTRGDDTHAMNGNAVMYEAGKILTVGGAAAYQDADASNRAYLVDITGGVAVRRVGSLAHARAYHNSVVLPDGKVLVLGGQARPVPFSDNTSVYHAEMWDPATERFTTLAPAATPRNYHSVAALLPDGRVFSGGGGLCGNCATNHADGQIFTPPYLLNADGTARSRPSITAAPATAAAGAGVTVTTNRAVTRFSLVRLGAVTHTVNNDQRRIALTPTASSGTSYTLSLPADRGVLLPGYYMLFALDSAGVPSVARTVRIT
jgi:galactose oxidase